MSASSSLTSSTINSYGSTLLPSSNESAGASGTGGASSGAGVSGQSYLTGDASPVAGGAAGHLAMLLETLASQLPNMSTQDMQAEVTHALALLNNQESTNTIQSQDQQIKAQQAMMQLAQKAAEEAAKKAQEAAEAASHMSVWDKIKMAFEMLGALISVAVGAVLVATGFGAALGGIMIAAGIVGVVSVTNSIVESATGAGIVGNIVKAAGGSAQQTADADMGFNIGLAAVGVALAIAGGGIGFLDGSSEEALAVAGSEVAEMVSSVGNGVNAASSVVSGVATGVSAGYSYQATIDKADAQDKGAEQKRDQAMADLIAEAIKTLAEQGNLALKAIAEQFSDEMKLISSDGTAVNSVKFAV